MGVGVEVEVRAGASPKRLALRNNTLLVSLLGDPYVELPAIEVGVN